MTERAEQPRENALLAAADFIESTSGIGQRTNDYADGWYDGLAYALGELRSRAHVQAAQEAYTVERIREAFAKHASPDDWGVPAFYEAGLIAALRGEYDTPTPPAKGNE